MGKKRVVVAGGVAISFADPGGREAPRRYVGLDLETGAARWEREIRLIPSDAGLLAGGGALSLHGFDLDRKAYTLYRLDPRSGETTWSAASSSLTGAACTDRAVLLGGPDEIAIFSPDGERVWTAPADAPILAARGDRAYAHTFNEDKKSLFLAWQGDAAGGPIRAPLPEVPAPAVIGGFMDPLFTPGSLLYAQYAVGRGVWRVDVDQRRVAWNGFNRPDALIQGVVATPHAAVSWARQGDGFALVSLDLETGLAHPPPATRVSIINAVFWIADRLIITGLDEAEAFVWKN
jgi:hypothetical protein